MSLFTGLLFVTEDGVKKLIEKKDILRHNGIHYECFMWTSRRNVNKKQSEWIMPETNSTESSFIYVPVTNTLVQLGLYMTGAGSSIVAPDTDYPSQTHPELYDFSWRGGRVLPEYQFVFISEGTGEFETLETGKVEVVPGTMMILFPDVWHRYRPHRETGWTEHWISVNGDLIFNWQKRRVITPSDAVQNLPDVNNVIQRYQQIIKLLQDHPRHQPVSTSALVFMIITQVLDHLEPARNKHQIPADQQWGPTVLKAMTEIWNQSHRQISVATIADRIGVTRRTLERMFADEVGYTVYAELTKCRIERSTCLLSKTQVHLKSIAFASGFSSVANMSRVFRRELNITPSEYRKQNQQG